MSTDQAASGELAAAVAAVPAGAWAVGVSGGADSVALLWSLRQRRDLSLHVVHLDHETRQGQSAKDAAFVVELARRWQLPITLARRSDIEPSLSPLPANRSARFRAVRLALFARVLAEKRLAGVVLAHHADDQAETVMLRLLRGGGPASLAGMAADARVAGVRVLRPLLGVRSAALRAVLREAGQGWREDLSNALPQQRRNRVRMMLAHRPELTDRLLALAAGCASVRRWTAANAPQLPDQFCCNDVSDGGPLARAAAGAWLVRQGVPASRIERSVCDRLIEMANDAATPSRQTFPGNVRVRRRAGSLFSEAPSPGAS